MMHRIATLILKELQALLRERQSRMLLIVPVLLQLAVFPFASTLEVQNNTLAVFNQDSGGESIELIQRLSRAEAFTRILYLHSEREQREIIDRQQALLVLRFPPDFSRTIAAGRQAVVQAILDGRRSNSAQIALGYARQIVQGYLDDRTRSNQQPVVSTVLVRHWFNSNLDYVYHIIPSLVAIIT